tara:strand:+ start:316 stop:525 length:210 start_codon:yes stop_codon:yes gene_type:complete
MEINNYLNYVCSVAEEIVKSNNDKDVKVIDGIADIEINGIKYQAQIILEPNEKDWVDDDKPTIRKVNYI